MKKQILIAGIASCLLIACNHTDAPQEEHHEVEATEHHEHEEHNIEAIQLIDGQKWTINEEMKPFIEEGEKLVNAYLQEKDEDYKSLANNVKEANNHLIKSCTMEGESHDELHKWLHPHLDLTKALGEAENIEDAQKIVNELEHSYQTFHEYFQ
ncbi:MAG: hypothetical protein H3C31_02040 [Brumimicrobium sp.]|nr:hypothetical protein [Brumimicrobium sp.]MCO5269691.1 hypothetical protein [Brumimicrobium sp.]